VEVGELGDIKYKEGKVKVYYFHLCGPHLTPSLERAAKRVKAELADIALEGGRIVIEVGDVKAEFKLLKSSEADFLLVRNVAQALTLYK